MKEANTLFLSRATRTDDTGSPVRRSATDLKRNSLSRDAEKNRQAFDQTWRGEQLTLLPPSTLESAEMKFTLHFFWLVEPSRVLKFTQRTNRWRSSGAVNLCSVLPICPTGMPNSLEGRRLPLLRNSLSQRIKPLPTAASKDLPVKCHQSSTLPVSTEEDAGQSLITTTTTTSTTTTTTKKIVRPAEASPTALSFSSIPSNEIRALLCPLCNEVYQMTSHRPIGEISCGHTICYQCFVLNTNQFGCVQCQKSPVEVLPEKNSEEKSSNPSLNYEERTLHAFQDIFQLSEVRPVVSHAASGAIL